MKKIIDILKEIRQDSNFEGSRDFIEDDLLDSFDIITFVAALEEEYGAKIKGTEIVPENFASLDAIAALIEKSGKK